MKRTAPFAVRIIMGTFTVTLSVQYKYTRLKGKLIPVHTIGGIWGSGGIAPLILNHNTGK
jgi:hypothetical protein